MVPLSFVIACGNGNNKALQNSYLDLVPIYSRAFVSPYHAGKWFPQGESSPLFVHESPAITLLVAEVSLSKVEIIAQVALVSGFNGLWPCLAYLHDWIIENWNPLIEQGLNISPLAQGFFAFILESLENLSLINRSGHWFSSSSSHFIEPWSPSFDPSSTLISSASVWVRLPNFPLHLWILPSLTTIGNALGKFYCCCLSTTNYLKTTFARIYVQIDLSKGLLVEINSSHQDYKWVQKMDYENVLFR